MLEVGWVEWNLLVQKILKINLKEVIKMMMGIWFIFFIPVVVGIIMLIIWASNRTSFSPIKENNKTNTLDLLKERYVRGEITKEEFDIIKNDVI